ncbi:MAG: rRNA maturation RNase YbeY [Acidimicrobiia bacterium]|nr:rRNA maturation RNase YbeY [Acidimicrobiia bacterium]MDH3471196.1 rRNA maturation RNase YbeY [Acidimicrobiia bacterium]
MSVFLADEQEESIDPQQLCDLADSVLSAEGLSPDTELAVMLVGEDEMTGYNKRFMKRKGPTDVLAFPLEDAVPGRPPTVSIDGGPLNLGDVFICPAVVRRNAAAGGVAFEDEMALMVVHGILHILGYDHGNEVEADAMESRERELLMLASEGRQ